MTYLAEWSDARTAALYLKPCTPKHLNELLGGFITRRSGNRPGALTARSGGWQYHRDDLERVRAIMDAFGVTPLDAARTFARIRSLNDQGALVFILGRALDTAIEQQKEVTP
jgi:hypothetical protein